MERERDRQRQKDSARENHSMCPSCMREGLRAGSSRVLLDVTETRRCSGVPVSESRRSTTAWLSADASREERLKN